jgi:hypothetical protein
MSTVTITLNLDPHAAAGLKRFADKVSHSDAMAVLYPHVARYLREEQAYQIVQAFEVITRALADARVSDWPWIESGHP